MANTFGTYWTNFAKYGSPNSPSHSKGIESVINWPAYNNSANGRAMMNMEIPTQVCMLSLFVFQFCVPIFYLVLFFLLLTVSIRCSNG